MKKIYIMALASLICGAPNVQAEEGTTSVPVKMTYVNMDKPETVYGEIPEGETAMSGYNKIVDGGRGKTVEFANTGWNVNYITYLQVNASAIKGNIMSATLTFEASGSTDGKRTTGWGVGYNASTWSSTLTYNDALRGIVTMGDVKWTTNKAANEFEELSFDITEAIKKANKGIATILVYETNAGGGYIKNPKVEIEWTTEPIYNVTFQVTNEDITPIVTMNDKNVTLGTSLPDGTYSFNATAAGYKDYEGSFTVAGENLKVEYTMEPKDPWNYTVKNNVNDQVIEGSVLEGLSATVPFSRYILADNGTVWMKDAINKEYNYSFTPDTNNYETTLEYAETERTDGVFFIEAENLSGLTEVTANNANIRCSNAAAGYIEVEEGAEAAPVEICKLGKGKYTVETAVWGGKSGSDSNITVVIKAGDKTVLELETTGSWTKLVSEEFELDGETSLTVEGPIKNQPVDYFLVCGSSGTTGVEAIEAADAAVWYSIDGVRVAEPTRAGLYIRNGKKVIVK